MNKAVLTSLLILSFTCVLAKYRGYGGPNGWGGYGGWGNYGGYGGYNGYGNYGGSGGYNGGSSANEKVDLSKQACSYAVANANGAFQQVIIDARNQENDWILYADLDIVDEIGYYLANTCNTKNFAVVSQGKNDQACRALGTLLQSILDQEEIQAFRGDVQHAIELGEKALKAGKGLGKGCEIKLVQKEPRENKKSENKDKNQQQKQEEKQQEQIDKWRKIGQKHQDLAKSLNKKYEDKYKNQQNQQNQESHKEHKTAHAQEIQAVNEEEYNVKEESNFEEEYNAWSEEEYSFGEENEFNEESNWFSEEENYNLNEEEYEIGEAGESTEELSWFDDFGHGWGDWDKGFGSEEEYNTWNEEEYSFGEENELNEESNWFSEEENYNLNEEEYEIGESNEELSWFDDFGHGWSDWDERSGSEEESQWQSEEETTSWNEEEYALGEENELNEEFINEEAGNEEDLFRANEEVVIDHSNEELNSEEGEAEEGSFEDDIIVLIQEGNKKNKYRLSDNGEESDSDLSVDDLVNFMGNLNSVPKAPRKASWTFQDQIDQVNDYLDLVWE